MAFLSENFNSWQDKQTQCRRWLGITDESSRCLPYHGLGHALVDILYSLREFWPNRKTLLTTSSGSPLIRESVQGLVLSGCALRNFDPLSITDLEHWFSELPKDILAVVAVRDHCMTGQVLVSDDYFSLLNSKRIPHIEIQNGWAWSRANPPLPFGIQIRIIDASKAIVVLGSRLRLLGHSAHVEDWSELDWDDAITSVYKQSREDREFIETFEVELGQINPELKSYFVSPLPRLFDRTFIVLPQVHGEFFLQRVLEIKGLPSLAPPGYENRCETTNLARWKGHHPWNWWGANPLTEAEQRNSVVLSTSFLKEHLEAVDLNNIYLNCRGQVIKAQGEIL